MFFMFKAYRPSRLQVVDEAVVRKAIELEFPKDARAALDQMRYQGAKFCTRSGKTYCFLWDANELAQHDRPASQRVFGVGRARQSPALSAQATEVSG